MSTKAIKQQIRRLMDEDPHGWDIKDGNYSSETVLSHPALEFSIERNSLGWETINPKISLGSSPWLLEKSYKKMIAFRLECAVNKVLGQVQ